MILFVCELIEKQLQDNKYKEVIEYIVQRRNEIENKKDYLSEQEKIKRYLDLQQKINRLNNLINELEKWAKEELEHPNWASCGARCMLDKLKELKENNK